MKNKFKLNILYLSFLLITALVGFASCDKKKDIHEPVNYADIKRTILVYAVNFSSLRNDFKEDKKEILRAMENVDLAKYRVLLYETVSEQECSLSTIELSGEGKVEFKNLKTYPRYSTSTSPERIGEVITDALRVYPNASYDLVFWGHGTSWVPTFDDHNIQTSGNGMAHSYGGEYNGGKNDKGYPTTDSVDIDALASAIPDHVFETIWFDCCYMSAMEVIYQFRNKCEIFVGYPTEVWQEGMAYDAVLPLLCSDKPDVVRAAELFFEKYDSKGNEATVAVINMGTLEAIADTAREIINCGTERPGVYTLMNYSRIAANPFVDLKDYLSSTAELNGRRDLADRLLDNLQDLVVYHAETAKDFKGQSWDLSRLCGISVHFPSQSESAAEQYYRTLDWYKRIY